MKNLRSVLFAGVLSFLVLPAMASNCYEVEAAQPVPVPSYIRVYSRICFDDLQVVPMEHQTRYVAKGTYRMTKTNAWPYEINGKFALDEVYPIEYTGQYFLRILEFKDSDSSSPNHYWSTRTEVRVKGLNSNLEIQVAGVASEKLPINPSLESYRLNYKR